MRFLIVLFVVVSCLFAQPSPRTAYGHYKTTHTSVAIGKFVGDFLNSLDTSLHASIFEPIAYSHVVSIPVRIHDRGSDFNIFEDLEYDGMLIQIRVTFMYSLFSELWPEVLRSFFHDNGFKFKSSMVIENEDGKKEKRQLAPEGMVVALQQQMVQVLYVKDAIGRWVYRDSDIILGFPIIHIAEDKPETD